jgi:hypothetical protein
LPVGSLPTAMTCPLRSRALDPLRHYYRAVRPSPAHRYFRPRGWSRLRLVWGFRSQAEIYHLHLFLSLVPSLCSTGAIIPSSRPALRSRRRAQKLSRLAVARPHLDSFEHHGTLGAIGMTIRGEPAFGRGSIAPQLCIRWVQGRTMMQPCASAAKLRSPPGGPLDFPDTPQDARGRGRCWRGEPAAL